MAAPEEQSSDFPTGHGAPARRLRGQSQREFEIDFFGGVLERDPLYPAVLRVHGNNLSATGQYARALQFDRRLARLQPDRPIPWYNLACSYARMGMTEPAFAALARSVDLGYRHFEHMARDADLKSLRPDPRFARLLLKRVRRPERDPRVASSRSKIRNGRLSPRPASNPVP